MIGASIQVKKAEEVYNWSMVEKELVERQHVLQEACLNAAGPRLPPNAWEFVIDAHHNLVWCNVFKAASSSWMFNFNLLGTHTITLHYFSQQTFYLRFQFSTNQEKYSLYSRLP